MTRSAVSTDSAQFDCLAHPINAQDIGGRAETYFPFTRHLPDLFKGPRKHTVEFLTYPVETPVVILAILHPFKVTDRHSSGVSENVW